MGLELIQKTAGQIDELVNRCIAHAGGNLGSLTCQWSGAVFEIFNNGMAEINCDFSAEALDILDKSMASKGNGPLLWESMPDPKNPDITLPPDPISIASPIIMDLDSNDKGDTTSLADGTHFDHDGNRNSANTHAGNKGYLGLVLTDEIIENPETADLPIFEQNFLFNSFVTH